MPGGGERAWMRVGAPVQAGGYRVDRAPVQGVGGAVDHALSYVRLHLRGRTGGEGGEREGQGREGSDRETEVSDSTGRWGARK